MRYVYLVVIFVAILFLAYMAGVAHGYQKCRADFANATTETQIEIIKQSGKIDAETFNHDTGDIRRVLREKYTIGGR